MYLSWLLARSLKKGHEYKILSGNLIEAPAILISMLLLHIHDTYVAKIHLDIQQEWLDCMECNWITRILTPFHL